MTDTVSPWYRNDTWSLEDGFGLGRAGDQVARMALEWVERSETQPPTLGSNPRPSPWGASQSMVRGHACD